jgi:hypothetical protein
MRTLLALSIALVMGDLAAHADTITQPSALDARQKAILAAREAAERASEEGEKAHTQFLARCLAQHHRIQSPQRSLRDQCEFEYRATHKATIMRATGQ